ncbi:MAG: hypothetical protein K0S86_1446 [Geminicoccaceae bacterium]|jgi:hypothetical protein|nr:hypothetical protein [Geminicoccaceae bacterium]
MHLRTIKASGGELKVVGPLPDQSVKPTWSPNAAWIAFDSTMGHFHELAIWRIPSGGAYSAYRVTPGTKVQWGPAW